MGKQTTFAESPVSTVIEEFLSNPYSERPDGKEVINSGVFQEVSSLNDFDIDVEETRLVYVLRDPGEDVRHLYIKVQFESDEVEFVEIDSGVVIAPLAGRGYKWRFNSDGELEWESPWIS